MASEVRSWPLARGFAGYRRGWLGPDLLAGLTLAAIAIPEQMATARLAGLPPQAGLFAFIAGTLGFAVFGASGRLSVGADSTISPIFAGALALMAASGSPAYVQLAAALAVLTGGLTIAAGRLKMGWIGDLLSIPVTAGFMAGIAVHILASQLPLALGVAPPAGDTAHRLWALAIGVGRANAWDVAIAGGVLAITAGCHRLAPRLPGALLAVTAATLASVFLRLEGHGVAVLGALARGAPRLAFPTLPLAGWTRLVPLAILVSLVAMAQTAATTRAFADSNDEADVEGDFVGLGVAGLLAGLVGAFPVDTSPPRTGVVAESGGRTPLAGLTAAAITVCLLMIGTGLLTHVPAAALAGVLLFVAGRIVRLDQIRAVLRESPAESLLIAATLLAIVFLPIEGGVAVGVALSVLNGVWASARTPVRPMHRTPGTTVWWPTTERGAAGETVAGVVVLTFQAPLTFLNAGRFEKEMLAAILPASPRPRLAILEAAGLVEIDYTAGRALAAVIDRCRCAGVAFAVARLESVAARAAFDRLGLTAALGPAGLFDSVAQAIAAQGRPS